MFEQDKETLRARPETSPAQPVKAAPEQEVGAAGPGASSNPSAPREGTASESPPAEETDLQESTMDKAEVETSPEQLLAQLEAELAEAKEAHLRAVADLQNFRRRAAEERAQLIQFANQQLIAELLPVLDDLERAAGCVVEGDSGRTLHRGVCMILQQFFEVLGRFGVERMQVQGQKFDPARHEAVERLETPEIEEGTIVEELLPGYTLHGRVVRPAKVKVAVEPSGQPAAEAPQK